MKTLVKLFFFAFYNLLCVANSVHAENPHLPELNDPAFQKLPTEEKVYYINEHFYAIFSTDYQNAKELTKWAAATAHANGWKTQEGYALMNHGIVTYLKGEYDLALQAYLGSQHLFDSLQDDTGRAMLLAEMANYYQKVGHGDKKYSLLDTAEALSIKINDRRKLAKTYGLRASFLFHDGRIDEAREHFNKNFDIYLDLQDSVGLGYAFLDQAYYAQGDKNFKKALFFVSQSIEIRKAIHDEQGLAESLGFLGDTYFREKMNPEAIKSYRACVAYSQRVSYPDQARQAYAQLVKCYHALGLYEQAFYFQDSAFVLKDSLFNIARTKTIEELKTKYETEKKEQQLSIQDLELSEQKATIQRNTLIIGSLILALAAIIAIATLMRNRLREKQELALQEKELDFKKAQLNAIIQSQEKERKRFAVDLHDGFGQLISVLKMNVDALRNSGNKKLGIPEKNTLFEKSTTLLDEMYDELRGICFNLMPQTLVNNGLPSALMEFADRVNMSGKIKLEVYTHDMEERLHDLLEISVYRIIQEWTNNIMKYANAESITIQITKDAQELTLTIEDDGIGFDANKLIRGKGNGWKNISSRANLIQGTIDLDTNDGKKGTTFILNAPIVSEGTPSAGMD